MLLTTQYKNDNESGYAFNFLIIIITEVTLFFIVFRRVDMFFHFSVNNTKRFDFVFDRNISFDCYCKSN